MTFLTGSFGSLLFAFMKPGCLSFLSIIVSEQTIAMSAGGKFTSLSYIHGSETHIFNMPKVTCFPLQGTLKFLQMGG